MQVPLATSCGSPSSEYKPRRQGVELTHPALTARRCRFHAASDDSEDDDEGVDVEAELSLLGLASAQARQRQALQTCRAEGGEGEVEEFGLSGQLDDEEDSQLNPYRVAYESGWTRANEEMEKDAREGGREVKP